MNRITSTIHILFLAALLSMYAALFSCSGSSDNPLIVDGADSTPPATPKNLSFLSVGNGEIQLVWDANTEPDFAGYKLYRAIDTDTPESYQVIYDSTGTTYIDTNLEYTTRYYYRISAYDLSDNESPLSESIQGFPQNTQPPNRPENLIVNAQNMGTPYIRLIWDTNTESDLKGYRIYRGMDIGSVNTLLDSTTNTLYNDYSIVLDTLYYYKVTAYDKGGEESAPTEPESDAALSIPVPISPVNGAVTSAQPTFTWKPVPLADKYKIFVQTSSMAGEFWTQIVESDSTSVQYSGSKTLESGISYYWKVATITTDTTGLNSISSTEWFRIQ